MTVPDRSSTVALLQPKSDDAGMRTLPPHTDPTKSRPEPVWSIQLLGGARVRRQGGPSLQLVHRSVSVLLARLAMSPGGCVGREELVELLWPDVAPEVGRARLRRTLSRLRTVLGAGGPELAPSDQRALPRTTTLEPLPLLSADRHTVQLRGDAVDCDVLAFEGALRAGAFEAARALYLGDLLPGCYDEWVVEERARLADLRTRLPTSWLTVGAGVGPATAAAAATAISAVTAAVTTAAAAPSTVAAAAHATTTQRTAVWLLRPAHLPLALSSFFGREVELAQLLTMVHGTRCVTLTGPVGCGKSRLALEAARCSRGFERVVWVALGDLTDGTGLLDRVRAALPDVAGAAAVQPTVDDAAALARQSTLDDLANALRGRRLLVVLDNAERAVETGGADAVLALLGALPSLHTVVTSRRALRIDGERVIALPGLPVAPHGGAAEPATPAEALALPAVALFVDRARNVLGRFEPDTADCAEVLALVRALDGLPLAIDMAASRLRTWSLKALRLQCTDGWAGLARPLGRASDDPRHASMRSAVDVSWQLLEPQSRALLSAMATHDGPCPRAFPLNEVQALVGPTVDAHTVLDALVADSLLHLHTDASGNRCFVLQGVLRAFVLSEYPQTRGVRQPSRDATGTHERRWWDGRFPESPNRSH